jgi:hypothetical protein
MAGDPLAQRWHAERFGIAEPPAPPGERRLRRRDRGRRSAGRRLADLHVDHAPSGRFEPRRGRDHVHHHERRHRAAR